MKKIIIIFIVIFTLAGGLFVFRKAVLVKIAQKVYLRQGQPMKFGNYTVVIDKISGNEFSGIKISGENRELAANSGSYVYLPKENSIRFCLLDGTARDGDPASAKQFRVMTFKQFYMKVKLPQVLKYENN